ncbi:MAG TPA: cation diffusion facilitator family transporter [Tepidisphaeraceae bacterium]|nr:cation diffusion facilitator family transporter [Tepidisphaeraceae bacterium]
MSALPTHIPRNELRVAVLALVVAIVLVLAKFLAWFLTGSAAIFADALETIVNVAAATFAIYSLHVAHTPADREHPYGHGKIEFFASGFEGGMIVLASLWAIVNSVLMLIRGGLKEEHLTTGILVLCGALIVNGLVGLLVLRTGRKSGSVTLEADGKHLLSDAVTSIFALVALLVVRLTHKEWFDPAIGIVVAIYIGGIGVALMRHAAGGLMDRQDRSDQLLLQKILDSHLGPSGVQPQICSYHKLRHRHSGRYHWVDFHIMLPPNWDIRRGHEVASSIEYEIEKALGEGNATAHIEPCKDPECRTCRTGSANNGASPTDEPPAFSPSPSGRGSG